MSDYNDNLDTTSMAGDLLTVHSRYVPPIRIYVTYYSIDGTNVGTIIKPRSKSDLCITMPESDTDDFRCWLISSQGYAAGQVFYNETSVDVNAMMSCHGEYTLTYDSNGGYGTVPPDTKPYSKYVTESADTHVTVNEYSRTNLVGRLITKQDHRLQSWLLNGKKYEIGSEITLSDNMKAVAVWQYAPDHILTVKSNNVEYGTVSDSSGVYQRYTVVTITATAMLGCRFSRWLVNGEEYTEKNTTIEFEINDNTAIVAEFEQYGYVVTYDGNGGTPTQQLAVIDKNTKIGEMPVTEKANFYFVGWFTRPKYGDQITEEKIIEAPITLYAQYIRKTIRLKVVGQLTIDENNVATGFSENNYLVSYSEDDYINFANDMDLVLRVYRQRNEAQQTTDENIFGIDIQNSLFYIAYYNYYSPDLITYIHTNWMLANQQRQIYFGNRSIMYDVWYQLKTHKNRVDSYNCYTKSDNESVYTDDYNGTGKKDNITYGPMLLGASSLRDRTSTGKQMGRDYFQGFIDVANSYMTISGQRVSFEIFDGEPYCIVDHEQNNIIDREQNVLIAK